MKILKKEIINYKGKVFDLKIKNDPSYNIEEVIVHNSAAGSLLSYSLGIVQIDPIQHGLYFERFMNPERNCVTLNNYVLLKNGSYKKINEICLSDEVQTPHGDGVLLKISEREVDEDVYLIELENGLKTELTKHHIVPVERNGEIIDVHVDEIKTTDFLIVFMNMNLKIKQIQKIPYKGKVYDLTFDKDPYFFVKHIENKDFNKYIKVHNSSPDIDLDIMQGGRESVRNYLEEKYGKESVYGVMTQSVYQIKSAIQDVSRGLGLDTSLGSTLMREVTKLQGLEEATNIREYFNKLLKETTLSESVYQWIEDNEETIYWADKLLGLTKNVGTHAGGVVIAPGPIYDYIPVTRAGKEIVTAFRESDGSGHDLSDLGLLKLDLLGLKTLNVIKGCIDDIKQDKGIDITDSLMFLDLKDPKLFKKFNKGNNVGIFQLHGSVQDHLIKTIQPDSFDDIVAINAINRPGPLETFGKVYGQWKRWERENNVEELKKVEQDRYPLEFMKDTLSKTYGCLLFQEQMMLMVCEAGGFNMGEADSFRRALGWRKDHPKYYTVEHLFEKLEKGMEKKGYERKDTELFLEYCRRFMGYSFNLCLTENHKVVSKNRGEINLLEVNIGEEILAFNTKVGLNEFVKVDNIYDSGEKFVYLVTTESGKEIECTLEHTILTEDGFKKPLIEVLNKKLKIKVNNKKETSIKEKVIKKRPIWKKTPLLNGLTVEEQKKIIGFLDIIYEETKELNLYDPAVYSIAKYRFLNKELENEKDLNSLLLHIKLECKNIIGFEK